MLQNQQDLLNLAGILTGSVVPQLEELSQTKINDTQEVVSAGSKGLFFLRVRATDFIGTIGFYLQDAPVLQLTSAPSIDTGDIYVICDSYDAIGIDSNSGIVTIEGYKNTPNQ